MRYPTQTRQRSIRIAGPGPRPGLAVQRLCSLLLLLVAAVGPRPRPAVAQGGCPPVQNTPAFTIVYGAVLVDGVAAAPGTVIAAHNPRGDVVGCFEVAGAGSYGAMYVYGEDTSVSPPVPGMRAGETVAFYVDGVQVAADPSLAFANDRDLHPVDLDAAGASSVTVSEPVAAGDAPPVSFGAAGLTLDCASGPGGTVTVTLHQADYADPPGGVGTMSGHWEISSDMSGPFDCDIVFDYQESDLNGASEAEIAGAARWNAATVQWDYVGGSVDASANTVTVTGVTAFSPWLLLTSTPPRVVAPLSGARAGGDLQLAWPAVTQDILGSALTVDHYVVYRRLDEPYFIPTPADVVATHGHAVA